MSGRYRRLLLQALVLVAAARVLLPIARLRRTRVILQAFAKPSRIQKPPATAIERCLSSAIRRAGGTCLANALAAEAMLAGYGYAPQLRIGVALEGGGLQAHAWLEHQGRIVTGGPTSILSRYQPLPSLEGFRV